MDKINIMFAAAVAAVLVISSVSVQAQPTLAVVKKRGQLVCGINGQLPGFSVMNAQKEWVGFEIDFCRALAAAALGDATKVTFVPLTTATRFDALKKGEIDVLVRNTVATLERTAKTGVRDTAVTFFDGQGTVVPKQLKIDRLRDLDKRTVCMLRGTPYQQDLDEWFLARKRTVTAMMFDTQGAMAEAFFAGRCNAVSQDVSALASTIVASGKAADYLMLPEIISKHPLAPYVRAGDDEWFDVVRWTHYAMLEAEERRISKNNVDEERKLNDPATMRFLGVVPGNGKALGLDESWAYNIIKQVGNYGEIYERHFGVYSQLQFKRGLNALWSNGGAMIALPMR